MPDQGEGFVGRAADRAGGLPSSSVTITSTAMRRGDTTMRKPSASLANLIFPPFHRICRNAR
jgi:hypothetical protein